MLRARHSGKCMDVEGGSTASGARVLQWACHGGANQVFDWRDGMLVARHSNQCLDFGGDAAADGTGLVQRPCKSGATPRFRFQ